MPSDDEVGCLWEKTGQSGVYFSGMIEMDKLQGRTGKVNIVVFSVREKKNDRQPDYRIKLSRPREDR